MSKEFYQVKQLIQDFMTEDQDLLKQEIINTMTKNSIDIRLNKNEIQLNKIEKIVEQLGNKFTINTYRKTSRKLKYKR